MNKSGDHFMDKLIAASIYGQPTTNTTEPTTGAFTMADFQRAKQLLRDIAPPPVWYTTTDRIDPGKCYVLPATTFSLGAAMPEVYVIHNDAELAFLKAYPHAEHIRILRRVEEEGEQEEGEGCEFPGDLASP